MALAIRDYIYIDDLAKVFYQLIDKDVYNRDRKLGQWQRLFCE